MKKGRGCILIIIIMIIITSVFTLSLGTQARTTVEYEYERVSILRSHTEVLDTILKPTLFSNIETVHKYVTVHED